MASARLRPRKRIAKRVARHAATATRAARTLSIDIGGTGIKAMLLDHKAKPLTPRLRIETPRPATPDAVLAVIEQLANASGRFDRVSVGFPGVIKRGTVKSAPNLDRSWHQFDLAKTLQSRLSAPVRVANDSGVQGYGVISGHGVEMVITLGTGFGCALFVDGKRVPNLELAHHPFRSGRSYEQALGARALGKVGRKRWNRRLALAIETLEQAFNFDRLYLGGGNSTKVRLELPKHVRVVSNLAGLIGGVAIWTED